MSTLIYPFLNPLLPLLLLTAFAYYFFSNKRRYVFLFSFVLFYFFSMSFPVRKLVQNREFQHLPLELSSLNYQDHYNIIVLGSGKNDDVRLSENLRLSQEVLSRLIEALKWCKRLPNFTLICSGPVGQGDKSQALLLKETAVMLGIDASRIQLLEDVHNTQSEAEQYVKFFNTETPIILCTSALHMTRAKAWFEHFGVRKIHPAPANYKAAQQPLTLQRFLPQWSSHKLWQSYLKERIGVLVIS